MFFQQAHLVRYGDVDLAVNLAIWITNIIALLLADAGLIADPNFCLQTPKFRTSAT